MPSASVDAQALQHQSALAVLLMLMSTPKAHANVITIGPEMTVQFARLTMYAILDVLAVPVLTLTTASHASNMLLVTPTDTVVARHTGHRMTAHSSWATATPNATDVWGPMLVTASPVLITRTWTYMGTVCVNRSGLEMTAPYTMVHAILNVEDVLELRHLTA